MEIRNWQLRIRKSMVEKKVVDVSAGIIWRTILILLALSFLYLVRDVLVLLVISIILVSAIDPVVDWLQRKKIPRPAGVLIIYFVIFIIFGLSVSFLIPPMADQFRDFGSNFSNYTRQFEGYFGVAKNFFQTQHISVNFESIMNNLVSELSKVPEKIYSGTVGVFSGFISVLVVFSITFYMTVKENGIKNFIISIVPENHKEYAASLTERIKVKIGKWTRGQLLLMLIIFFLDFIGLSIVGIPYALSLAIFAGVMEIIPYIGPIISAIPGVLLGFMISPLTGLLALLVYVIVQQFENHIIIPQVMKKAVGLNPIVVILALLVGAKLGGALGAILAVPIATAIGLFVGDLFEKNKSA